MGSETVPSGTEPCLMIRLGHVTFRYLVCFKWMRSNVPALLFFALSSTRRTGLVWYFARNPNSEPANNG